METIRSITYIACFLGVAIAMLDIIRPSEKLKKQVRFVFSLVFLIAIIGGILNNQIQFEIPTQEELENTEEYIAVSETYTQCLADNFKTSIEKNLDEKLKINSIIANEVNLELNISENEEISIIGANISINENMKKFENQIKSIIENEIGKTEVEIYYDEK